jgi:hypothetical protein
MADGRKKNGGHSTKGFAGRKPKADEIKVAEEMDAVLIPKAVWQALAEKVKEGDGQCIKTWLSYRYGMPKQSTDITTNGDNINILPIEWVE